MDENSNKCIRYMYLNSDNKILSMIQKCEKSSNSNCAYLLHCATITRRGNIVNSLLSRGYDASSILYGYSCLSIVTLHRYKFRIEADIFGDDIYRRVVKYLDYYKKHLKLSMSVFIPIFREFLRGNTNLSDEQLIQLHNEAKEEEILIVKSLLKYGADINFIDRYGCTILHNAVECQNIEMVKLLLDNNIDFSVKCYEGGTAFKYSARNNNIDIIKLIVDKHKDCKTCKLDDTAIFDAIMSGSTRILRLMLSLGLNVNIARKYNYTPLYESVMYSDKYDMTELLLKHGADPNIKNNFNETPLSRAIDNPDTVKLLLEYGASTNIFYDDNMPFIYNIRFMLENGLHPLISNIVINYEKIYTSAKLIVADMILSDYRSINSKHHLSSRNMEMMRNSTVLNKIIMDCEKELENIRSISLCGKYTLGTLLKCNKNQGSNLLRNPEVYAFLENNTYDFPIYGRYLEKAIKIAKKRLLLIESTMDMLNCCIPLYNYWHILPYEIRYFIVSLIDDDDTILLMNKL